MPRQARIDIPGLLQHVIARGIERREIFRDDIDRSLFVKRLSTLLEETDTDCFAWALIPNHFHLLLRPNRFELKLFMRRLLTGYAINFNLRHDRSGHVFQNRYKSIVCEEDPYLLELIRYIHLNPLRAKLVPDLASLNVYPWCGHSVLMGNDKRPGQVVKEVLIHFGKNLRNSRLNYFDFIKAGLALGRRDELIGGGFKRSHKGHQESQPEMEIFDERILGSGDFIEGLRQVQVLREKLMAGMTLAELIGRVATYYSLETNRIRQRSKDKRVQVARDVFCYIAVRILHHPGTKVGHRLNIHRSAVSHAVQRGELIVASDSDLVNKIMKYNCSILNN